MKKSKLHIVVATMIAIVLAGFALVGCSGGAASSEPLVRADLSSYPAADMSGFKSLKEAASASSSAASSQGAASNAGLASSSSTSSAGPQAQFVEVGAAEAMQMMDDGESFVLFFAFPGCPWCERLIVPLSDSARDAGWQIAFVNTRKNPSWQSNRDIDGYDLLVERIGDYFDKDDDGTPHMYVPDLYFVRNGQVVAHKQGVLPGYEDPDVPMTEEQEAAVRRELEGFFALLQ